MVLLSSLGGYDGGQAEYVRIPFANAEFSLIVPDYIKTDEQVLFLSDILPTGYFATDIANVRPGDDVAVFGAGPVGYFAVMSSFLRGAARVFSIDHWPNRLTKTKDLGAEIVNFDYEDPVDFIRKETGRKGTICIDAVGYEAVGHMAGNVITRDGNALSIKSSDTNKGHDHSQVSNPAYQPMNPMQVITWICQIAKKFSTVSIPGVYGSAYYQFPLGLLFNRNVSIHMGQCPVKKYSEQLFHLIETKRIDSNQGYKPYYGPKRCTHRI